MSKQQLYLVVFLSILSLAALPGFFMDVSAVTDSDNHDQRIDIESSVRALIPDTVLDLQPISQEKREQIIEARKININEADIAELQQIPRVGESTAQRIIDFREAGGVFYSIEDMAQIGRIGAKTVENLRPYITVGPEYMSEAPPEARQTTKIDINTADYEQLQEITGVGSATAADIIAYRERYGGFDNVNELLNVSGIGPTTLERMKPEIETSQLAGLSSRRQVQPEREAQQLININTASMEELQQLPRVGPATASSIIEYRQLHGSFSSLDDLTNVSGIGPATVNNLRAQATVR